MRTTIDINDAKLKEIRERAKSTDRSFREMLDEILALGLAAVENAEGKKQRIQLPTHPLGTKPGFQGVSLNQLYDQIEAEKDSVLN